jgi:hypothetical protein
MSRFAPRDDAGMTCTPFGISFQSYDDSMSSPHNQLFGTSLQCYLASSKVLGLFGFTLGSLTILLRLTILLEMGSSCSSKDSVAAVR